MSINSEHYDTTWTGIEYLANDVSEHKSFEFVSVCPFLVQASISWLINEFVNQWIIMKWFINHLKFQLHDMNNFLMIKKCKLPDLLSSCHFLMYYHWNDSWWPFNSGDSHLRWVSDHVLIFRGKYACCVQCVQNVLCFYIVVKLNSFKVNGGLAKMKFGRWLEVHLWVSIKSSLAWLPGWFR